jgi:anthranilate synthase component 1
MDTAITIRTVLVADGKAYVQAGAGIVADSVPAREYEETLGKARALLRAAAMVPATRIDQPPAAEAHRREPRAAPALDR